LNIHKNRGIGLWTPRSPLSSSHSHLISSEPVLSCLHPHPPLPLSGNSKVHFTDVICRVPQHVSLKDWDCILSQQNTHNVKCTMWPLHVVLCVQCSGGCSAHLCSCVPIPISLGELVCSRDLRCTDHFYCLFIYSHVYTLFGQFSPSPPFPPPPPPVFPILSLAYFPKQNVLTVHPGCSLCQNSLHS
jgi:hypothetical protein